MADTVLNQEGTTALYSGDRKVLHTITMSQTALEQQLRFLMFLTIQMQLAALLQQQV